ncbi:enoyl-CoA hydratase/isomerase family protein, putative [Trypanosoma cruzi]|uniref:3-hydroxyisobutyryl-CoA hydrolase n=2 Tax=Trypanosoma cruzi TaxID=5693 RepID=Q4DAM7_TRYCC|nr:enoyl-CoA hydratase/isomerase family protein, putative [Trypanosoma cruzi]EAN89583.1 enoyl-CoA hydratase/isomerase family protein, putative [Trypanosoma cruzi]|eukprot:XP_811434.1 enoyl-CoA hydratase/isomerase family protein [Trypanosoma cruzi strain CL Brener]
MDLEMVKAMQRAYVHEPHAKGDSALFVVKGAGNKSFCAGGDIVSLKDRYDVAAEFFYTEYQLNYHILTMPNPQVSLWDGYVMGGGVGVSVHGRYRVASERAVFAMPETAIGLFPDVGASWFLPRLKMKGLGLYLGLTGARLKGADVAHTGLATHYVPSARFCELEERLCHIDDPAKVEACLEEFAVKDLPPFTLEPHRETIEKSFALEEKTTVEGIYESLSADGGEFAKGAINTLNRMAPTSLRVSLEMQKRGVKMTDPADVFRMDYIGSLRTHVNSDFHEGVRALLVDKTKDPKWKPAKLSDVTADYVEAYFKPLGNQARQWHPTLPY